MRGDWLSVPNCTGFYQRIWVQIELRRGNKQEMKKGCEA